MTSSAEDLAFVMYPSTMDNHDGTFTPVIMVSNRVFVHPNAAYPTEDMAADLAGIHFLQVFRLLEDAMEAEYREVKE